MTTIRTVLVTGGAGYIGSHACKLLARAGYDPIVFDNLSTGWAEAVQFGPLVQGDLLDRAAVDDAFARVKPDAVMHFAALSDVGQSMRDPALYWRNNVVGSMNLIDAAVAAGVQAFVFSSTCATYGEQDGVMLCHALMRAGEFRMLAGRRCIRMRGAMGDLFFVTGYLRVMGENAGFVEEDGGFRPLEDSERLHVLAPPAIVVLALAQMFRVRLFLILVHIRNLPWL